MPNQPQPEASDLEPLEPRDYHISVEELRTWEIGEVPQTDPKLQTNMRSEATQEKVRFLEEILGLRLPPEWTSDRTRVDPPCIHVAYTFASNLSALRDIQDIESETAQATLLRPINVWMDNRIEKKYGWRRWIPDLGMTTEGFYRRHGSTKNTDQLVSEEEMLWIIAIFRDKVRKR